MTESTLPGTGPWSWLEPGLWVYRSRELDLLGQADGLLADAAHAAQAGGAQLLEAKRRLHAAGVGAATAPASVGGGGHRYVVQIGVQFLAGYRDLNLRDVAGIGHGALLARDPDWHGRRELAAVIRGALVGLATTEPATDPQSDPELAAVSTRAVRTADGWEITGRKAWVSRVLEADAFVVFARSPEHLGAFYVPAGSPGLTVVPAGDPDGPPADSAPADGASGGGASPGGASPDGASPDGASPDGVSPDGASADGGRAAGGPSDGAVPGRGAAGRGWSWGDLVLDKVAVPSTAVLGSSVGGVAVFRRHLADYRPLTAATCLGAAAAAVDAWVERVLSAPNLGPGLPGPLVERLGDLRGRVLLALGGLFTGAARPGGVDGSWSKLVKAQAVNTAIEVVRAVEHEMETVPGGVPGDALAAVRRVRAELTAFEAADGAPRPLLRDAGERFVRYSAAILDEISEPTSTMPRPRLPD